MGFWILLLLLILLLLAMPRWPYSREWGYWPGGLILAFLIIWIVVLWVGAVAFYWPWAEPVVVVPPPTTTP